MPTGATDGAAGAPAVAGAAAIFWGAQALPRPAVRLAPRHARWARCASPAAAAAAEGVAGGDGWGDVLAGAPHGARDQCR